MCAAQRGYSLWQPANAWFARPPGFALQKKKKTTNVCKLLKQGIPLKGGRIMLKQSVIFAHHRILGRRLVWHTSQ